MSEDQKKQLEQQLWNIANTLRGKMNADEFRDYILGFIFYKYLSEKMDIYANGILKADKIKYTDIKENSKEGKAYIEAIKEEALGKLGYFLKPSELFSEVAKRGNSKTDDQEGKKSSKEPDHFILEDLQKILTNIQLSTMGSKILGHSSADITLRYIGIDEADIRKGLDALKGITESFSYAKAS